MPIEVFFFFTVSLLPRLSLLPSFPELPGNVCAFHPEKWIFSFGKKRMKKARIPIPNVRASAVASRMTREEGCRRGGGRRIESKTATVAKGK
ncbi:hypothetical protein PUN28_020055 [Cardiocondyla obscurior]|uniref:Secreted protein n=1 Tax=Cardiocondyla obscurior TaxID=286306 RepID=A0AAW2E705_9HYME